MLRISQPCQASSACQQAPKPALDFDLLRQHIAAESDAPIQGDRCKVRALAPLAFRPGAQGRRCFCQRRSHQVQQPEISSNRPNAAAIFRALASLPIFDVDAFSVGQNPVETFPLLDCGK